ncbi:metallophosphoesterase [Paenibacillus senegalensis]|uniref:metallophosphoesterase n=1 Tax=Paenibacillus senegalensis TaxID=1465766 RepID=UPI0002892BF4|nr:metallophosphoesterase [Paenibacillus senegalensis]
MNIQRRSVSYFLVLILFMSAFLNVLLPGRAAADSVIPISSAADLELIRSNPSGDFKLTADIELIEPFVPIPVFSGTLDGDGHVISGLFIHAETNPAKVAFIVENQGIIERLGLVDATVIGSSANSNHWAGGMTATNRGTIRECFITGVVTGGYRSAGMSVHNHGLIKNTYADIIVKAKVESAALVAVSESGSVLESSYAVPRVYSEANNTGGLSAYAYTNAVIKNNALMAGTIANGSDSNIARITGRLNGTPTFLNNVASVNALVQGSVVSGGTANNHQGLSVTDEALTLLSTYQTTLGWDFQEVWEMNTETGRPVLQYFDEIPVFESNSIIYKVLRDESEILSSGVIHRQMDFIDGNGNIQKANIIDVDLTLPQNTIIVGTADNEIPPTDENGNYIRVADEEGRDRMVRTHVAGHASTTAAVTGKTVIAGVNGEFFTRDGPEGYMIKDGSAVINGVRVPGADGKNYPFHGFFGIRYDGTPVIGYR